MRWLWKHGYLFRAHLTLSTLLMILGLLVAVHLIGLNAFFVGVMATLLVIVVELIVVQMRRGNK